MWPWSTFEVAGPHLKFLVNVIPLDLAKLWTWNLIQWCIVTRPWPWISIFRGHRATFRNFWWMPHLLVSLNMDILTLSNSYHWCITKRAVCLFDVDDLHPFLKVTAMILWKCMMKSPSKALSSHRESCPAGDCCPWAEGLHRHLAIFFSTAVTHSKLKLNASND